MKEEIYQWMKSLAVFYILLTAVLHLVPSGKYERYVRFFMGLLLIFMLCTPLFTILGKGPELAESFQMHFQQESVLREQEEMTNLQEHYLQQGYEWELRKKIIEILQKKGIDPAEVEVHIEGERVTATLYMEGELSEEQERGIADGLLEAGGIREGEYQIKAAASEPSAVGGASASGTASGRGSASGIS